MARPRRHIDGKQITLRLSGAVLDELDARAEALGVDRSQLINQLIKNNLDQNPYAAAEAPAKYGQPDPARTGRLPTAGDTISNTESAG